MKTLVKGIFDRGTIRFLEEPPKIEMTEVVINFLGLPYQKKEGNALKVLSTLDSFRGILPKSCSLFKARSKIKADFSKRIKQLGIK